MTSDELEAILNQTLEDRKLSRGEKRALKEVLGDAISGEKEMAIAAAPRLRSPA